MVILADVSLSMNVEDIPATGESMLALRAKGRHVRRIDALRQALSDLLHVRMQVSGRVSRVALLAFNDMTFPKFPRDGGMVELDGSSPRRVIDEYSKAVEGLQPYGATRIEVALHAAAELLYRHGHPGNERLIVLVSDGAHWTPGRDSDTGRVFEALDEPISLMEHLHRDMKVRLHAIGISTRELFLRRYRDEPGLTPDHRLLAQLVKVGGGDPATVGGLDVLVDYFSAAGGGLSHRVRGPLSAVPDLRLGPDAAQTLTAQSRRGGAAADGLGQRLEDVGRAVERIEAAAQRLFERPLYPHGVAARAVLELRTDLTADALVRKLRTTLRRLRPKSAEAEALGCVKDWSAVLDRLEAPVAAEPADLPGLAAVCRSAGTEPAELAVAVLAQLADGLADLATGLERAPRPAVVAAEPVVPKQHRAGRMSRTDVGSGAGFVLKN
jgi:hypothetical protein